MTGDPGLVWLFWLLPTLLSILCPPSTWALSLSRLFLRYVTLTVAAMLVTGVYVTMDGIFVGHILGRDGLAGMMLAYPICAVLLCGGGADRHGPSSLASFYLGKESRRGLARSSATPW